MRNLYIVTVAALLAGAAAAQNATTTGQSAGDYFRHSMDASSSSSSSSSSTAGMLLYTSCKAFKNQGGIKPGMSRDDVADAARAAGCTDSEINALTALWDVMPHS